MTTGTSTPIDHVHGGEAVRWGGWDWRGPRRGDHFRTCSYCGSIHPEDLAAELVPAGRCAGCGADGLEGHYRNDVGPAVRRGVDSGIISPGELSDEERRRLEIPQHPYDPGGAYPSWADQKYGWPHKFYVQGLRPRDAKLLHCFTHYRGEAAPEGYSYPWVAAADLTRAQRKILSEDGMLGKGETPVGWYAFRPKTELFAKFYTRHLADPGIAPEVIDKIAAASGVRFHFSSAEGFRVGWHGVLVPCDGECGS